MLIWAGVLAGGIVGLTQLKQDFDPEWFLPEDSSARIYSGINDQVLFIHTYYYSEGEWMGPLWVV